MPELKSLYDVLMKCLDSCGWNVMPNNLVAMVKHLEECNRQGAWSRLEVSPTVVWRDGGFAAVTDPGKEERTFDIDLTTNMVAVKPAVVPFPGAAPLDAEPVSEELQSHRLPSSSAPIPDTPRETRIVAEFEDPTEEPTPAKKGKRKKVN